MLIIILQYISVSKSLKLKYQSHPFRGTSRVSPNPISGPLRAVHLDPAWMSETLTFTGKEERQRPEKEQLGRPELEIPTRQLCDLEVIDTSLSLRVLCKMRIISPTA